jgi:hypothetical protein
MVGFYNCKRFKGLRGAVMSCPWVCYWRSATTTQGKRGITCLQYGIGASYHWRVPLIRTHSQIYVLTIKSHCNGICAAYTGVWLLHRNPHVQSCV